MKGYQLTFFTIQGRHHGMTSVATWLVELARELGLHGATSFTGSIGFGHHRHFHSAHFIELTDQPVEVTMVVTEEECDRLFARLAQEKVSLFYTKASVEFGSVGLLVE